MEFGPKFQVLRRTGLISPGFQEDTQLDYNIEEQNTMDLELRIKKTPTDLNVEKIKKIKAELNLEAPNTSSHSGMMTVIDKQAPEFQTNFYFHKRIGYLLGPKTLVSLDVDLKSLDSLKFYGMRPCVTHQFDKLTTIRFGLSMMPGSTALLLGASRTIAEGM